MKLWAPSVRTVDGWRDDVTMTVDDGRLVALEAETEPGDATVLSGPVVPGMPNAHSHSFQYAMAGLAQQAQTPDDSFWTWRKTMYALANAVDPDDVEAIAAMCFVDLLEGGFTSVAEFHYLHHPAAGGRYDDPAELLTRVFAAGATTGLGVRALPVLYAHSDVGAAPPRVDQRRFVCTPDDLLDLAARGAAHGPTGVAAHSLRAVTPDELDALVRGRPDGPLHLHIAEQPAEVTAVRERLGATPIRWLLDHQPVDGDWHLVHATHTTPDELVDLAATGASVVICPTTEADLGDGLFDAATWWAHDGVVAIGTDAHVGTDAADELRLLEYGQRLSRGGRNLLRTQTPAHLGDGLWDTAMRGGARAVGLGPAGLAVGHRADFVVLADHPRLAGRAATTLLDTVVFASRKDLLDQVWVAGRCRVAGGRHLQRDTVAARYRKTVRRLAGRC